MFSAGCINDPAVVGRRNQLLECDFRRRGLA
jgi:hypothetical protein